MPQLTSPPSPRDHALCLQLDKDLNTMAMRIKEWYSWHFPVSALLRFSISFGLLPFVVLSVRVCAGAREDRQGQLRVLARCKVHRQPLDVQRG